VVHVDLSVLVWFLSGACMIWSVSAKKPSPLPYLEEAALICYGLGIAAITLAPLSGGNALMSNYIPVLYNPPFFLGLALLFCGTAFMLLRFFTGAEDSFSMAKPIRFARFCGGGIAVLALFAFILSFLQMPAGEHDQTYYDMLFWGGGHLLQFLHVQMAMICWLLLVKALHPAFYVYPKHLIAIFALGPVCALAGVGSYAFLPAGSPGHQAFFTNLMILSNGIAPTIFALWLLPGLLQLKGMRRGENRALWSSLLMSLLLFIYGGVLGGLIHGQNVVIPAHYHGSIVGVTLAFMGLSYLFMPRFGWQNVSHWRLAFWQPIIYGTGQLMHVTGLAVSGGYGVLRKTPGGVDALPASVKAALGFMGLGGTLAIIGGFMFVLVVWKAIRK